MKQYAVVVAAFAFLAVLCFQSGNLHGKSLTYEQIAERILDTYKKSLSDLSTKGEQHFGLRMYRMTGDESWYPPIAKHLRGELRVLRRDLDSLSYGDYYDRRLGSQLELLNPKTRKGKLRRALFAGNEDILLQLDRLHSLATIDDYSLTDSAVNSMCRTVGSGLNVKQISAFLCDSQTIKVYGAKAINAVEYLKQLELADIRDEYQKSFREVFPDSTDRDLDDDEFSDKVYGLTHIIIAASGYYQWLLDKQQYVWILDYFEKNQKRIKKTLTADILAEIGLCYLLTGDTANPMVEACRKEVAGQFSDKAGMILSPSGKTDLPVGAHRNVLAYMLFTWSGKLYPGPHLDYQNQVVRKKGD